MDDLSTVMGRMQERDGKTSKGNLKAELLQWQDMQLVKGMSKSWKDDLWLSLHRKKSTLYKCIQAFNEYAMMILVPVEGGKKDEAWDVEECFAEIKPKRLLQILKFTKGATNEAVEEWLHQANHLSDDDWKKLIREKEGKTVCDCCRFREKTIQVCEDCGTERKKAADGGE